MSDCTGWDGLSSVRVIGVSGGACGTTDTNPCVFTMFDDGMVGPSLV